ncbi:carbonyl reductase [NADPH] 2-like [Mya arenaria]|uniref:carbonyl reductase [NADPH] 2-like n=1 Tax=Mya arenaria TaxID=6604 RepID=UPI0022E126CA|nr:carbonyl reductase [NADPH] 2-like [Mya arenaria]
MSLNLKGKKFLVTGAGRGIGRELVKALYKEECIVYALNRSKEPLDTLVHELPAVVPLHVDLEDWEATRACLEGIEVLDGVVNNAGLTGLPQTSVLECSKEFMDKVIDCQVFGAINTMQVVAKKMIEAGRPGSFVNVSSVLSHVAAPGQLPYCFTKAALDMITKQFALELGPHNIRVNSINPTLVLTDNIKKFIEEVSPVDKIFTSRTPCGRLPEVTEVVVPIMYLLSDMSSMVSGTHQVVDGGMLSCFITQL